MDIRFKNRHSHIPLIKRYVPGNIKIGSVEMKKYCHRAYFLKRYKNNFIL